MKTNNTKATVIFFSCVKKLKDSKLRLDVKHVVINESSSSL